MASPSLSRSTGYFVGLEKAVFSHLDKRCPSQYHYLYICPVKSLLHYPSQLLACCKGSHHPPWRPDPESSGSKPQLPRGADEHLIPPQRDTRLRSATSHLPPLHMVTTVAAIAATLEATTTPAPKSSPETVPTVELPSWHRNFSAEQALKHSSCFLFLFPHAIPRNYYPEVGGQGQAGNYPSLFQVALFY